MSDLLAHLAAEGYFTQLRERMQNVPEGSLAGVAHATTVVGVNFEGGVAVCADGLVSTGYDRLREAFRKIFPAGTYGLIGFAGVAGFALDAARAYQVVVSSEECRSGKPLRAEQYAFLLNRLAREFLGMTLASNGMLATVFLAAVYDPVDTKGHLYTTDPFGTLVEHSETSYAAIGSGAPRARSYFDLQLDGVVRASADDAVVDGLRALRHAAATNLPTGPPFFAATTSREGIRFLSPDEVAVALDRAENERSV